VLILGIESAPQKSETSVVWVRNHVYPVYLIDRQRRSSDGSSYKKISSLLIQVYITLTSQVSSNRGNQISSTFQPPIKHIIIKNEGCHEMQCNMTPWNDMPQNTKYSLNRIYMILLGNTSRVHDPWGTREVHIPTQTISTCLCGRSQRTIINQTIPSTDDLHVPNL